MVAALDMMNRVKRAWSGIEAPPEIDMAAMASRWSEASAEAFVGVKPVDVDIDSDGFNAATPLTELPKGAAAAYLGTYLISLLSELNFQEKTGYVSDIMTRAHTMSCLQQPWFWNDVIREKLPSSCIKMVEETVRFLLTRKELLRLDTDKVKLMKRLAEGKE